VILDCLSDYVGEVSHRGQRNAVILASGANKRLAFCELDRQLHGLDVLGGFVRMREVVGEEAWLEKAVLEDGAIFVEVGKVRARRGLVSVPALVLEARSGFNQT
jgi:hypothetical protein